MFKLNISDLDAERDFRFANKIKICGHTNEKIPVINGAEKKPCSDAVCINELIAKDLKKT